MISLTRIDRSPMGHWWWTIDRWLLIGIAALVGFGSLLILAASPAVAERIGTDSFHFVKRQLALTPVAVALMIAASMQTPRTVRRWALIGFGLSIAALALTFVIGVEIKGARRWISLGGLSLQPSEFVKPCFAVIAAWLFAEARRGEAGRGGTGPGGIRIPGRTLAIALYGVVVGLLLLQPDLGQAVVVSAVFFAQFFLAGLPLVLVVLGVLAGMAGLTGAYFVFPHVASRINRFMDPASGDSYQVDRAMEAFMKGGLWGRGPGEGRVKEVLPDAHADFVFAVAGEELGLIVCLLIVGVFAGIVLRSFSRLMNETNLFVLIAGTGLTVQFGLQAVINMASSLHLMPTKGMTLPFLSYGGSSLIALGLGMGMLLALTRRRYGSEAV